MSEPDSEIFSAAPSALKSSEVLFCPSLIFMHILLQQVDGVDPVNCTRERKVKKCFYLQLILHQVGSTLVKQNNMFKNI